MNLSKSYYVDTTKAIDMINIAHEVRRAIQEANMAHAERGFVLIAVPHPDAAVVVMEKTIQEDFLKKGLEGFVTNSLIRCLLPKSVILPVERGKMVTEPWQEIFLIDYDTSGRRREFRIQLSWDEPPKEANEFKR